MAKAPKKAKPVRLTDWQERTLAELTAGAVIEWGGYGTRIVHPDGTKKIVASEGVQKLIDLGLLVRLPQADLGKPPHYTVKAA